jgi:hypothetical protein
MCMYSVCNSGKRDTVGGRKHKNEVVSIIICVTSNTYDDSMTA